jgi:hypothetical protein
MLNERWILPDWCTVAPGRAEHLKDTLIEFDSVLDSQLASVLHQRQRQPDPMQSLVALSAPWSNSQDTIKPDFIAPVYPPSIISDTSGFLPFIEDTILTPGKHICSKLSGPESSLIVHFYESHVVLSSAESIENIKDCRASANRVRVSLMALQDQPELEKSLVNTIRLKEIKEGAEQSLERESIQRGTQLHIIWNYLVVAILIYETY